MDAKKKYYLAQSKFDGSYALVSVTNTETADRWKKIKPVSEIRGSTAYVVNVNGIKMLVCKERLRDNKLVADTFIGYPSWDLSKEYEQSEKLVVVSKDSKERIPITPLFDQNRFAIISKSLDSQLLPFFTFPINIKGKMYQAVYDRKYNRIQLIAFLALDLDLCTANYQLFSSVLKIAPDGYVVASESHVDVNLPEGEVHGVILIDSFLKNAWRLTLEGKLTKIQEDVWLSRVFNATLTRKWVAEVKDDVLLSDACFSDNC